MLANLPRFRSQYAQAFALGIGLALGDEDSIRTAAIDNGMSREEVETMLSRRRKSQMLSKFEKGGAP